MSRLRERCPALHAKLIITRFDTTFRMPDRSERLCFGIPGGLCEDCHQLYIDPDSSTCSTSATAAACSRSRATWSSRSRPGRAPTEAPADGPPVGPVSSRRSVSASQSVNASRRASSVDVPPSAPFTSTSRANSPSSARRSSGTVQRSAHPGQLLGHVRASLAPLMIAAGFSPAARRSVTSRSCRIRVYSWATTSGSGVVEISRSNRIPARGFRSPSASRNSQTELGFASETSARTSSTVISAPSMWRRASFSSSPHREPALVPPVDVARARPPADPRRQLVRGALAEPDARVLRLAGDPAAHRRADDRPASRRSRRRPPGTPR